MNTKLLFKIILTICLVFGSVSLSAQEAESHPRINDRRGSGTAAAYSSRDATVLSMMGWGVGLTVGIAVLCGTLIPSTSSTSH